MLVGATKSFLDMVLVGEMVKNTLKTGKLDGGESNAAKKSSKEKGDEVNTIKCGGYQQQYQ